MELSRLKKGKKGGYDLFSVPRDKKQPKDNAMRVLGMWLCTFFSLEQGQSLLLGHETRPLPKSYFPVSVPTNPKIKKRCNKKLKKSNSPFPKPPTHLSLDKVRFTATWAVAFLHSPFHSKKLQKRHSPLFLKLLKEIFPCSMIHAKVSTEEGLQPFRPLTFRTYRLLRQGEQTHGRNASRTKNTPIRLSKKTTSPSSPPDTHQRYSRQSVFSLGRSPLPSIPTCQRFSGVAQPSRGKLLPDPC